MNGENQTLSLTQVYDLLRNPDFVKRRGQFVEENGYKIYTTKMTVMTTTLGEVTLGTAYFADQKFALPVLFLSKGQVKYLRSHGIFCPVRKRSHQTDAEFYLCFPSRGVVERIEKL